MLFRSQLANIGSEVGRAAKQEEKDKDAFRGAVERALELFDLTLQDRRHKGRWKEIARARELFCDAITGGGQYKSSLEDLERYFFHYAYRARMKK